LVLDLFRAPPPANPARIPVIAVRARVAVSAHRYY
jgi:hypothetical protein